MDKKKKKSLVCADIGSAPLRDASSVLCSVLMFPVECCQETQVT